VHERGHDDDARGRGWIDAQVLEIALRVLIDCESSQERSVEVARGEAERAALILRYYCRDVRRAQGVRRAAHAGEAVVIGGQREGPRLDDAVVVGQEACGRLRSHERIATFVDDVVDAHVTHASRARELPESGRSDFRIRGRIER